MVDQLVSVHFLSNCASMSLQVGERQHVLVTEESFDAQYYVAHNKFYEQVGKRTTRVEALQKIPFKPHPLHHQL